MGATSTLRTETRRMKRGGEFVGHTAHTSARVQRSQYVWKEDPFSLDIVQALPSTFCFQRGPGKRGQSSHSGLRAIIVKSTFGQDMHSVCALE